VLGGGGGRGRGEVREAGTKKKSGKRDLHIERKEMGPEGSLWLWGGKLT